MSSRPERPRPRSVIVRSSGGPALPRELVFLASLWLVGSWIVSIGIRPPLQPSASSYAPGVRTMLLCIMIGLTIAWPLMRLSQAPTPWPIRRTLLDLVALAALTQVIVWPVRLVTTWPVERTFAIALFVVGWTAIVGAVIAISTAMRRPSGPVRAFGMATCCALCVAGPAAGWALSAGAAARGSGAVWDGSLAAWLGPLIGLQTLTGGGVEPIGDSEWRAVTTVLGGGLAAWIIAVLLLLIGRRQTANTRHLPGPSDPRRDAGLPDDRPVSSP